MVSPRMEFADRLSRALAHSVISNVSISPVRATFSSPWLLLTDDPQTSVRYYPPRPSSGGVSGSSGLLLVAFGRDGATL